MADRQQILYKAGAQSADDPMEFVMSTDDIDRMGDIVEQDWKLAQFRKNPIALYQHNAAQPIGTWQKVRIEGGRLVGRLQLAAAGTSELIDSIRSLVEQRILRAVSVGFSTEKYEALDPDAPWEGYRLSGNTLLECSLVSVPANANALAVKALPDPLRARLFAEPPEIIESAYSQLTKQTGALADRVSALAEARRRRHQINRLRVR